jgi:DNA-binding beta-propeller fold protein YncE
MRIAIILPEVLMSAASLARVTALAVGVLPAVTGCSEQSDRCGEIGVICTVAGTGEVREGPLRDGPALAADLSLPIDISPAPAGNLFVLDSGADAVELLDLEAGTLTRVIGRGDRAFEEEGCDDPEAGCDAMDLALDYPTAVALDGGDAIVADGFGSRLFRVDLTRGELTARYGIGRRGYTGDGGPAAEAALDFPTSVAIDPDGGILVLDHLNQVIRRIDRDGTIETVAGRCLVYDPDAACAEGQEPIACPDTEKLTCGDPETACDSFCVQDYAGDGGAALDARFAFDAPYTGLFPARMAITPLGTLLIADTGNHRVRQIDRQGVVRTIAGTGEGGFGGGRLNRPYDVAVAPDRTVYVADTLNHCVQAVDPGGGIRRVAGLCGHRGGEGDGGPALDAFLAVPQGVEVAGGVLYIADSGNHRIRAVRLE